MNDFSELGKAEGSLPVAGCGLGGLPVHTVRKPMDQHLTELCSSPGLHTASGESEASDCPAEQESLETENTGTDLNKSYPLNPRG
jgi:hypothetical protein